MSDTMHLQPARVRASAADTAELRNYYLLRAVVSIAWVAAAFTLGRASVTAGIALLIAYPAWDALANILDGARSGGLSHNRSQLINAIVSIVTTIAVAVAAATVGMHAVLGVFGVWAFLAGLMQLATGAGRWRSYGAQWPMMLSGAQSMLAGVFMIVSAQGPALPSAANVAPYAAFGAFYFLVSGLWLAVRRR